MLFASDLPAQCAVRHTAATYHMPYQDTLCVCPAATPPAGRCKVDADCGNTAQQCDTTQTLAYYTCSNGFTTEVLFGACVAKPTRAEGTPQQLCNACLSTVRSLVDRVVNTSGLTATDLSTEFQTLCVANNYSMVTCSSVAATIKASQPNLAKRAGALCMRMGQCSTAGGYTVSAQAKQVAATAPVVVVAAAGNDTNTAEASTVQTDSGPTTLTGALSACTIEGVVGGSTVLGTYTPAGMLCLLAGLAARRSSMRVNPMAHSPSDSRQPTATHT